MSYALVQQQVQKLVMTPELRQAIHLLQLSTADLVEYVRNELLQNPVLEEEQAETARERLEETDSGSADVESDPGSDDDDIDWERFFDDGTDIGWVRAPRRSRRRFRPCSTHKMGTVDGRKIPYGAEACLQGTTDSSDRPVLAGLHRRGRFLPRQYQKCC